MSCWAKKRKTIMNLPAIIFEPVAHHSSFIIHPSSLPLLAEVRQSKRIRVNPSKLKHRKFYFLMNLTAEL